MDQPKRHWTPEEDQLLMEIVQDYIDNGKTKKKAFEAAARKINRSSGTCSHRYYARLNNKPSQISLEDCITYLQKGTMSLRENQLLVHEKQQLLLQQRELKKKYVAYSEKQEKLTSLLSVLKEAQAFEQNGISPSPLIH